MTEKTVKFELTNSEKQEIEKLVTEMCANYDREHGCLMLDDNCFMLGKYYVSGLCRYFRESVLPLNKELELILTGGVGGAEVRKKSKN